MSLPRLCFLGCRQRQQEFQARPKDNTPVEEEKVVEVTHEENDWGIELVSENEKETSPASTVPSSGLKLAYEPSRHVHSDTEQTVVATEESLEDLMAQMKNI